MRTIHNRKASVSGVRLHGCGVDKIAVILPADAVPVEDDWFAGADARLMSHLQNASLRRWYGNNAKFRRAAMFVGSNGETAVIQLGRRNTSSRAVLRAECNPSKLLPADLALLRSILIDLLPGFDAKAMASLLVTKIHFAVDVAGVRIQDLHVEYSNVQMFTFYGKTVRKNTTIIESQLFGSLDSDFNSTVYDKLAEQIQGELIKALRRKGSPGEKLGTARLRQLKKRALRDPLVRFEIRLDKLKGVPLHRLGELPNRFTRFRIWDALLDGCPEPTKTLLSTTIQQLGVRKTVRLLAGKRAGDNLRRRARQQAIWWKPKSLWGRCIEHLHTTGLFSPAAGGR